MASGELRDGRGRLRVIQEDEVVDGLEVVGARLVGLHGSQSKRALIPFVEFGNSHCLL